jgi:hypothetical protein
MRVLVEQTRDCAVMWLYRLGMLGGCATFQEIDGRQSVKDYDAWGGEDDSEKIRVHIPHGWRV